ncbi:MAG: hypothetical protein IJ787_03335 [Bacilli bacterium]|nr:hypothetical protein [Bacilli bacterium]MDY6391441.1 hypothetical protein [Bacilli bacterium]
MKSKRSYISLHMLFLLTEKKAIKMEEVMDDLEVSRSSFFRALSDFRCYLQEHRPYLELLYDEEKETYSLVPLSAEA